MRNRNNRRRSPGRSLLIVLAAIAAVLIILATVFRITETTVVGNNRYSAQQITSDLIYDPLTRNSLWLSWKYRTATSEERTPYLSSVRVQLVSPGNVRIIVSEKTLVGRIQYNGQNVYFDEDGTVLEITDQIYDDVTLVTGVACEAPTLYQRLPVTNTALLRTMLSICQLMNESGLQVDSVEFDDNLNITALIGTVTVELGQDEYLEEKVSNLKTIYQQVENQTGTLNMSAFTGKNESVTFSQAGTSSAEQTSEADGDGTTSDGTGSEENVDSTASDESGESPEPDPSLADGSGSGTDTPIAGAGSSQDASSADTSGTSSDTDASGASSDTSASGTSSDTDASGAESGASDEANDQNSGTYGLDAFMVFDSSGTLRYDAHVVNGQVVDAYGNLIDGCYVNEDGNVVDAYWNVIDPNTGTLAQ